MYLLNWVKPIERLLVSYNRLTHSRPDPEPLKYFPTVRARLKALQTDLREWRAIAIFFEELSSSANNYSCG